MTRSELIEQLEAYLALNQQVSDESAPGMKFLRLAFVEMQRPSNSDTESAALRADLQSADQAIAAQNDKIAEYGDVIYDLLLQAGLLPEVDGEPVLTFEMALKEDPDCIEKLKNSTVGVGYKDDGEPTDSDRFISGVYNLLDVDPDTGLEGLFSQLEGKAQYLTSLEAGIAQRDRLLAQMDSGDAPLSGWVQDAIDLAHAVRGDLSPENRVMAKAAEALIMQAPRGEA